MSSEKSPTLNSRAKELFSLVNQLQSQRESCLALWRQIRRTGKRDLETTQRIYGIAFRKNEAFQKTYASMLRVRGVNVTRKLAPETLKKEDDRALLALLRYHEDLSFLFSISFHPGMTLESIFIEFTKRPLALANLEVFDSVSGTHLEEALYNLHRTLSSLADSPRQFFDRLDRIVEEVEEGALQHWHEQYSPEKTLLTILLRYWLAAMSLMQESGSKKAAVLPITDFISSQSLQDNRGVEIRLAVSGFGDDSAGSRSPLTVESETGTLVPIKDGSWETEVLTTEKWRIRCPSEELGPQVERVMFRIGSNSSEPDTHELLALRVRKGRRCESCTVEVRDNTEPWGELRPPDKWRDDWLSQIGASKSGIVLAVDGASIGLVDLRPEFLESELRKRNVAIERERVATLLPRGGWLRPGQVLMAVVTEPDHADAMRNQLKVDEIGVEVWDAYLTGYLRDVFPGLGMERDGVELLDEYLKPVREPDVLVDVLSTLSRVCREPKQLTDSAVNECYGRSERLRSHIKERLKHLTETDKAVLKLLHSASKGLEAPQAVGLDQILEERPVSSGISVPQLSRSLSRLWDGFRLLDRIGHVVPRYRFANRIYANLIEEEL